jgi:hypothetical protein
MTDKITLELVFEQGKRILDEQRQTRADLKMVHLRLSELAAAFNVMRADISNVYTILARHDAERDAYRDRFERIESRLNLTDEPGAH